MKYCGKFSETFRELFYPSFFVKKLETLQEIFQNHFGKISQNNHNLAWKFFNEYSCNLPEIFPENLQKISCGNIPTIISEIDSETFQQYFV